jgi:hypothetical protein
MYIFPSYLLDIYNGWKYILTWWLKARIGALQEVAFARQRPVNKFLWQWADDAAVEELLERCFLCCPCCDDIWMASSNLAVSQLVSEPVLSLRSELRISLCDGQLVVSSCSWGVPAAKDMSMEAEESPLLGPATKQEVCEDTTDWEDLECAVVIC